MLLAAGDPERARGNVLGDHRPGGRVGAIPDLHGSDQHVVGADPHVVAHRRTMLRDPVVVHEDRGRADVGMRADVGVAHVGQVRHLGAFADRRVLQLHVGPDVRPRADPGAGPQPGERTDVGAGADLGRLADRVENLRVRRDQRVPEQAVRADPGSGSHHRMPFQVRPRQDFRIRGQGDIDVDPGRGGVHDRDPGPHPRLEQPFVAGTAHLGELNQVVHALDLGRVGGQDRTRWVAVAAHDRHHVGEVLLALRIAGGDPLDRVGQQGAVKGVAAGIDLVDRPLRRSGVDFLDDLGQCAVVVPDDAPVPGRVRDPRGEHGHRVGGGGVLPDQRGQRPGPEQRHIAVGHDHDAGQDAERFGHHADRVAGAGQSLLHDHAHAGHIPGGFGADLVPAVAGHDDDALRVKLARCHQRVPEHAATAQGMQHLRGPRFHSGALACGKDDDSDRARFAHAASLLGYRACICGFPGPSGLSTRRTRRAGTLRIVRLAGCDGECVYPPLIRRIPSGCHDRMACHRDGRDKSLIPGSAL